MEINIDSKNNNSRERFTEEDDRKLKELVIEYGPQNWNFIASQIQTKNALQCRGR
jgi:hypothetical protein